ncbi:MAG TPA: alpha/beta fold hydrolase [Hypericibacter adhaerens]|jgi:pimeloyl-ACP methyl ester carboxylesterase|uniref:alpha/beta fold hydrolase n=1 Tax=Hypericibacter adhaerens TaxID=2602016 RepID=UPI002BF2E64F|nr:alpha/beta fold hydrolase [Hypericibacter adhaerens]HWA45344.1 alpha/beta fold hydrolase [Hypericibacter adhaerens]
MSRSPWLRLASVLSATAAILLLTASTPPKSSVTTNALRATVEKLGGQPCKDSDLTCLKIKVPIDHFSNEPKGEIEIEFAIHFANQQSKGLLIYLVGGPGSSGLQVAEDSLADHDHRLGDEMDVVFLDQRGTGTNTLIDCPAAIARYDMADLDPDKPDTAIAQAKGFVADCTGEMKHAELLPYVDTEQAIRDLEAFRQAIGAPKVWLYGESYGTQFAQQYAVAFPGAIAGVILDGVLDTALGSEAYAVADSKAVEGIFTRILRSCDGRSDCHADMGRASAAAYDELASRLAKAPIQVDFPLPNGDRIPRELNSGMLEGTAFSSLYTPSDRRDFLRVLAAAARGNLIPLMRLTYYDLAVDPETLDGVGYGSFYSGAYYAISCLDYTEEGDSPEAAARSILARAKTLRAQFPRFIQLYFSDRLPCAFWPARAKTARGPSFTGGDYPTVILNSDADPATPISNGYAVFDRVKHGYMITMQGGPHVIMGRGLGCPDKIVLALLLDGETPVAHEQICDTSLVRSYTPLTLTDPADAKDGFAVARAIETEVEQFPEIPWDIGSDPISVGCDRGGMIEARKTKDGAEFRFKDCQLWPGLRITGTGSAHRQGDSSDDITLVVEIEGSHHGRLNYHHDWITEATTIAGDYDGAEIATPRPPLP